MSTGLQSVNVKSCFQSINTPFTKRQSTSMLSKKTDHSSKSGNFKTISDNWYGTSKDSGKVHRFQTKSQKSLGNNQVKNHRYDLYSNFSKQTLKTYKSIQS